MSLILKRGVFCMALVLALAASAAQADQVTFAFTPAPGSDVQSVSLRGSFNNWGETPMVKQTDGTWKVTLDLAPGEYQYKYFIDGQWPQDMSTGLDGGPLDPDADDYVDDNYGGMNAVRIVGAGKPAEEKTFPPAPALQEGYARVHYHRVKGDYSGWGLHVWGDADVQVEWASPLPPTGQDNYGLYWDIKLTNGATHVGIIVHKGDTKDPGPDMFFNPEVDGREVWLVSGSPTIYTTEPDVSALALGDLTRSRAQWVDRSTIALKERKVEGDTYALHTAPDAGLTLSADGVHGGQDIPLTLVPAGLSRQTLAAFPFLAGSLALKLPDAVIDREPLMLKGQLAVSVSDSAGNLKDATGVQIPGVLDDLFTYEGPLGVLWERGVPSIYVWAPTAQKVWFHLFDSSDAAEPAKVLEMTEKDGVWSVTGEPSWKNKYYLYEVKVFMPQTGDIERNLVTDPYSHGLSMNSTMTQIVDLDDPDLKPEGWDSLEKPPLAAPEDIVIYELHMRDFSASDPTVPPEHVGTYLAFTDDTNGMRHLKGLAEAGLTHIHILPTFDIASVNEDKTTWQTPGDLTPYPPDSEEQQAAVARVQNEDAYNWGYDPFHYGTPEGSYSTDPDGSRRILEFREMVKALSEAGLRVVMDVVYNHTNASGLDDKSVLDKVVPGYYHRLNEQGFVETSTCCQNTATEHAMMERLMVDDLVHWARDYKIDGFRFDIMGHHMKRNIVKARDALHALRPETDGVDGKAIYLYGEGWDFGEVQGGKRGVNATQQNMAGTGVGTFNDRIRDAVRGGSAFGDRRDQGFATGLWYDPNGFSGSGTRERDQLLGLADAIRIGMAGNLRNYQIIDQFGSEVTGAQLHGVGYTLDPQEAVNYASAHDNETFFDKIQYAAARQASIGDRVRMQNLAASIVLLGQGVPFLHAGFDMLRSKSMDTDSYNSGDWFNKLDWSYGSDNFGVGLPIASKNKDRWPIIKPLLARKDITPGRDNIMDAVHGIREFIKIRKSSPLFRLRTGEEVQARVHFHNMGPQQVPGLIVMSISDQVEGLRPIDPNVRRIMVLINATKEKQSFSDPDWKGAGFALHPVQVASHDALVKNARFDADAGTFEVPPRTTAVFVEPE